MKLLFKQRLFSWFGSYDIFDQNGKTVYTVKGQLAWGHCLKIFDSAGNEIGTVKEKIFTWLPKFEIYFGQNCVGTISREFSFLKPKYNIDFNGWKVEGNFFEWDYTIKNSNGQDIATISKELFNLTDTYVINVANPSDGISALMLVLAIDAEKCSRRH